MKKTISLLLVFTIVLTLAACAGIVEPEISGSTEPSTQEQTNLSESTSGETVTEETSAETAHTDPEDTGTMESIPDETQAETQSSASDVIQPTAGQETQLCQHRYRLIATVSADCTTAGSETYQCSLCKHTYLKTIQTLPHSYADATCTAPQTCTMCGAVNGTALGHSYNAYSRCERCGEKDTRPVTGPVTFTAIIKSNKNMGLEGITVSVYTDDSSTSPAGTGVTDSSGAASIELMAADSYRVVLSGVSDKYAIQESYTFSSTRVNIILKTQPVRDPLDHSGAMYQVGDTMEEFAVTDIDGNEYQLYELLQEKKLVVLDFWYVTCNPCKKEFPYFETAYKKYADDVAILAIDPFDSEASIKAIQEELEVTFPLLTDPLGMAQGFQVNAYPTTVIIDNSGRIVSIHREPYTSEAQFLQVLESYM